MAEPLRVLHVIPSAGPRRGGPSAALHALTRALASAGLEVHVATTDDDGPGRLRVPLSVPILRDGVTYRYFPRQLRPYTFSWPLTRWLARHVSDFDLVHIHALFSYAALPAALCARRAGVPYVVRPLGVLSRWGMSRRRPLLKRASLRLLERRILASAAGVHYTSELERAEAAELGIRGDGVVIPLGVDPGEAAGNGASRATRAQPTRGDSSLTLLFLSRIDPKKGLDLLLRSVAELRRRGRGVSLVVAGRGDAQLERRLRAQAQDLDLDGAVRWTGFVEGRLKRRAFAEADVFVLPSYSENFGLAVVEAMAAGLPVVISDRVGIHREVAAAGAGLIVPCRVDALTDALQQIVEDADLRRRLGERGRELAAEAFSTSAMTRGVLALYESVAGRCVAGAPA